jgi:hypothetical protein
MSVGLKVADPLPNKKNKYIAPIFANSIFHCLLIKEGEKKGDRHTNSNTTLIIIVKVCSKITNVNRA